MKITILCSDTQHPVNEYLLRWQNANKMEHAIDLCRSKADLVGGDILFLISCSEIITKKERNFYTHSLVIHASDLPKGRGWSPHIWQILAGEDLLTCSLLEAEDQVDSGRIWKKLQFYVAKTALWDEINDRLFQAEIALMDFAIQEASTIKPEQQYADHESSYYSRRTPADSELDTEKSIRSQFNQLRVCDPDRFPAFFDYMGCRYILKVEKAND